MSNLGRSLDHLLIGTVDTDTLQKRLDELKAGFLPGDGVPKEPTGNLVVRLFAVQMAITRAHSERARVDKALRNSPKAQAMMRDMIDSMTAESVKLMNELNRRVPCDDC